MEEQRVKLEMGESIIRPTFEGGGCIGNRPAVPAMNPLEDDRYITYLAAQDDALASGGSHSTVADDLGDLSVELNDRLKDDVAWCEFVRSEWRKREDGAPLEPAEPGTPQPSPARFGRFEVRRELGRGSFGVVFLAYDPRLRRQVALKVPRPEVLDTADMRWRFEREARAAAGLDHPNIVPVFEAGEDGSIAYIASAYCPGPTLAVWLKAQEAPVAPRLAARIVLKLAEAIAHAHSRGVLHRDLKPGNVIMEPAPTAASDRRDGDNDGLDRIPRVTDFGLARLAGTTQDATAATHSGAILGTPSYMAPEQAQGAGAKVGPAADVYGLGAILYALLVGRPPFQADSVLDTLLLLRTQEPVAPSRLRPRVPRDLETVCLKCLAKEAGRRYATAAALTEDLRRFLAAEPIHARPTPAWELAIKWIRRHPAPAGLIGTAVAAAIALTVVILTATVRLKRERDRAEARRQEAVLNLRKARDAVDRMLTRLSVERLKDIPQVEPVRRALLEDALEFYRDFARQAHDDPDVLLEASRAYGRLAESYKSAGWNDQAERCHQEAFAIQNQLASKFPNVAFYRKELARTQTSLAIFWYDSGRQAEALETYRKSLAVLEALIRANPGEADFRGEEAATHEYYGIALAKLGRLDEAAAELQKEIDLLDELARRFPVATNYAGRAAVGRGNLAGVLVAAGRLDAAEAVLRKNLEFWEGLRQADPAVENNRSKLALTLYNFGYVMMKLERKREAEEAFRRSVELRAALTRDFPSTPHHFGALGGTLLSLGKLAGARGDLAEVRRLRERAIAAHGATVALAPKNDEYRRHVRDTSADFIEVLIGLREHDDASNAIAEFVALSPGSGPDCFRAASFLARCVSLAASDKQLPDAKRSETVAHYADRAMELLRESLKTGHRDAGALSKDPSFEALRLRAEWRALLAQLRKPAAEGIPKAQP
jgi:serine/threonine protein kinase